jgi:hypothetical protein
MLNLKQDAGQFAGIVVCSVLDYGTMGWIAVFLKFFGVDSSGVIP